jgi:hypothetical protein
VVRLAHSHHRPDLDEKYALDRLADVNTHDKNRDSSFAAQLEEGKRRAKVLADADVVVAPVFALLTSGTSKSVLDKYLQQNPLDAFDTVIVDDANMVGEVDLIQGALRYGCQRLILIGNQDLKPAMFGLAQ